MVASQLKRNPSKALGTVAFFGSFLRLGTTLRGCSLKGRKCELERNCIIYLDDI